MSQCDGLSNRNFQCPPLKTYSKGNPFIVPFQKHLGVSNNGELSPDDVD